jgi:replicative DNA helicase
VRAIIDGGKPAYRDFLDRSIAPELIVGNGKVALDFITEYFSKHKLIPAIELVEGKLGIPLPPNIGNTTAGFWADELIANAVGNEIKASVKTAVGLLDAQKNIESLEELQNAIIRIQKLQTGGGDSRVTSMLDEGPGVWEYYQNIKSGVRGIMTPWPSINASTLGFNPEELILFVARSGLGKCLINSTTCVDPNTGLEHTLEDIFHTPGLKDVFTWSREKGIHSTAITQKVDTGRKQCFKITFASGRTITVTPEHPLLTAEGWKRADAFKVGMTAALPSRIPAAEHPVGLPSETVFMLALLLAEGSYTGHHVGFSTDDDEILHRANEAAEALGGVEVKYRSGYDYDFVRIGSLGPNSVRELLRSHNIDNTLANNKCIPEAIYRLSLPQLSEFLSTFWMCGGYVDESGPGITLASERMVRQIQHLLLRLGIQSSVDYKKAQCNGKEFDAWGLRVYSLSLEQFKGAVPLWGHKEQRLGVLLEKNRNTNLGHPRVSDAFIESIRILAATRAGRWNGGAMFGKHNSLWLRPFKAFCEVYGVTAEYEWLWSSDIFWDVVESIEDVGEQKIYDLTVEPTSCFIANDIIVHNTWASLMIAEHAWTGYDQTIKNLTTGETTTGKKKHRVLYVTTEMSKLRIALRFYALRTKLEYGRLRSGELTIFEEEKLRKHTLSELKETGLDIVGGNFDFRIETLAAAIDEAEPELVIIDGIYLIKVPGKDRIEQAANAFGEVKRLTVRQKLPIVVTSQFNREVKANQASTARAESVALTDAAVWHSTLIFGMVQTDDDKIAKRMQVKQLKVRDGAGEDFELDWSFDTMTFSELPKGPPGGAGNGGGGFAGGGSTPAPDDGVPF